MKKINICIFRFLLIFPFNNLLADEGLLESYNRSIYSFNKAFDEKLFRPTSIAYHNNVNSTLKSGVSNFSNNLKEPWYILNSILQGKLEKSFTGILRFSLNSTIGIFGIFDIATEIGLEVKPESLGETLGVWGYKNSTFIVIPFLGASTIRDFSGATVEFYYSPEIYNLDTVTKAGLFITDGLKRRYELIHLESLLYSAPDEYTFYKNAYLEFINNEISDGKIVKNKETEAELDFLLED